MNGKRARSPRGLSMRPKIFVFCEGQTEENYIKTLAGIFKRSIEAKREPASINAATIKRHLDRSRYDEKMDKVFLMYDIDVEGVQKRIEELKGATALLSAPCVEVWFLMHVENVEHEISSIEAVSKLKRLVGYEKPVINERLRAQLRENYQQAVDRAVRLVRNTNPSSSIYKLIYELRR